jgi:predicted Zn finger-like uncharacterized protein
MSRQKVHFNCPHCDALYRVVRSETRLEITDNWVTCSACHGPIPARKGKFVFKYFLLRQPVRFHRQTPGSSQRPKTKVTRHIRPPAE